MLIHLYTLSKSIQAETGMSVSVDPVIFICPKYANERQLLRNELECKKVKHVDLKTISANSCRNLVLNHQEATVHG